MIKWHKKTRPFLTEFQFIVSFFLCYCAAKASAPPTISKISLVIAAWRERL